MTTKKSATRKASLYRSARKSKHPVWIRILRKAILIVLGFILLLGAVGAILRYYHLVTLHS